MTENRAEYILKKLEKNGSVKVAEISKELGCSEVTIRNDIKKLEDKGLLKRTHGGAILSEEQLQIPMLPGSILSFVEQKKRIAAQAASYIENGDTIILDDSSINYYLAKEILLHTEKNIVVITNSLISACVLSRASHVMLFMIGGQIQGHLPAAMGELATTFVSNLKASKAFVGARAVNFDVGVTSIGTPEMQIKNSMMNVVDKTYLLVNSSKFGGDYLMVIAPLDKFERIITDSGIRPEDYEHAKELGIQIDIV